MIICLSHLGYSYNSNKISDINDHYHIQGLPNRFVGQGREKYEQPVKGNKKFDTFKNWEKIHLKILNTLHYFQM